MRSNLLPTPRVVRELCVAAMSCAPSTSWKIQAAQLWLAAYTSHLNGRQHMSCRIKVLQQCIVNRQRMYT